MSIKPDVWIKKMAKSQGMIEPFSENQVRICEGIKDCDIDKITELLIEKGRQKKFPDITLK